MKAAIHSYESLAALDGHGLRYGVFFSGCPLRCVYCHNPDTREGKTALVTPEELVRRVVRYKPYFGAKGGVTFSGGEPLLQAAFLRETVPLLAEAGIRYAVDTSGAVPLSDDVRTVLSQAQTVLLDLKFYTDADYRRYTGVGMDETLEVLRFLDSEGVETVIRTVIVPGINDTEEAVERYAEVLRPFSCVSSFELLGFHTMGFFKYEALGIPNPLAHTPPLSDERLSELKAHLASKQKKNG